MGVFTPEKRSKVMSRIRGRDTKPELALRSMLHRLGYRFTVNGPKNRQLPGRLRPDIVLPKYRTAVFVHGCFWHGHDHCPHFRLPRFHRVWWKQKIEGNKARDLRNETALRDAPWHVVTIWECALKTKREGRPFTKPTRSDRFRYNSPATQNCEPSRKSLFSGASQSITRTTSTRCPP